MMNKLGKLVMMVGTSLALVFIFSCSSDSDDPPSKANTYFYSMHGMKNCSYESLYEIISSKYTADPSFEGKKNIWSYIKNLNNDFLGSNNGLSESSLRNELLQRAASPTEVDGLIETSKTRGNAIITFYTNDPRYCMEVWYLERNSWGNGSSGTNNLCGGVSYDPSTYRCELGELIGKCRGKDYYVAYERCVDGVIVDNNSNNNSSNSFVATSSSSTLPPKSSSSAVVSSSSSKPSSSSSVDLCAGFVEGTEREHYGRNKAQFCDLRDGKKYVYVEIDSQTWMAENLNYNASGSKCDNCDKYGRLYDWTTAMKACPKGWYIPSDDEWDTLINFVGGYSIAGRYLKTTSGWSPYNGQSSNGQDEYGFSALPGGYGLSNGSFYDVGLRGYWWSSSENNSNSANRRGMYYDNADVCYNYNFDKSDLSSVRCVKD